MGTKDMRPVLETNTQLRAQPSKRHKIFYLLRAITYLKNKISHHYGDQICYYSQRCISALLHKMHTTGV